MFCNSFLCKFQVCEFNFLFSKKYRLKIKRLLKNVQI